MAEEIKKPKPKVKKEEKFEYKLLGHSDKLGMILEMTYELETALFNHNLNMLDEQHSDYEAWLETNKEIQKEIYRMRFIYEKMGGAWENIQEEEMFDERGESI
tara:strand:+ start:5639 stop:5947 length:309 start_codon:yes stop_codon:yes gene_type:complete